MGQSGEQGAAAIDRVRSEIDSALHGVASDELRRLQALFADTSRRWFFSGQGRSGLVAQMAAMRFMHLGYDTHVLGEATAPSVQDGDGLLIVSGSGRTPVSMSFAEIARNSGAVIGLITATSESPLAQLADASVAIPTDGTEQFGGSLFEQVSLLVLDALVLELSGDSATAHEQMAARHTNMQ